MPNFTDTTITDTVIYIGGEDKDQKLFESQYELEEGMAFNSYVILDEKVCVMDTVDKGVTDQFFNKLEKALNGRQVDYLVVQHMEPDHSANIMRLLEKFPGAKLVCTAKALQMLGQFFPGADLGDRAMTVKEGDTLSLGSHTLRFIMAPMIHWPEVMMTYEESEGLFFSADAFGKFGVLGADPEDWACEARRYYFNIVGKYGAQVQGLLKKVAGLDIKAILPLHGPLLKEDLGYYIGLYNTWSSYAPEDEGVFVAYASIHGNTARAAQKLIAYLEGKGVKVASTDLCREDQAEAVEDAFRYDRMILMASSYDAGLFPPMEEYLMHLKAKTYQNRKVALVENGSWAPSAGKVMRSYVEAFKNVELVEPVVTIKSALNGDSEAALLALADKMV